MDDSDDSNCENGSSDEDSAIDETDKGLFFGPEDDEMPVEKPDVPTISSDNWAKIPHLSDLTSVSTRGGAHKIDPLTTLPKFMPGENYYSGSLAQKVERDIPIETVG